VAIPGQLTTAHLALRLWQPEVETVLVPFDRILDVVAEGGADAGLVIHEGQLTYGRQGLHRIVDLGVWWSEHTGGLPLPLGGNAVRRDLGLPAMRELTRILRESIDYGLTHREEALAYALDFGRGLDGKLADRFVGMYVNDLTRDYGERGRAAIRRFLEEGAAAGVVPELPQVEFVG
jgi:1,4-dihydroxy-6-naphthoate synthase